MTEKKQSREMGVGPSTKKLKSMLKILAEHGVARYKDSEFEIELVVDFQSNMSEAKPDSFSFGNYDEQAEVKEEQNLKQRDPLGFTDEDYLWRSAETTA
tara:strand:- start:19548 stop:19844 length:297 start_codon:yes stop_codon:yes gene_type:complete